MARLSGVMMKHVLTNEDLFLSYDVDKLKGDGNIKKIYKSKDKIHLARKIFLKFMHLLMSDIVEGGVSFKFPTGRYMLMCVEEMSRQSLASGRQKGYFKDLDPIASNFKAYNICLKFFFNSINLMAKSSVRVSKEYQDRMIEKCNEGYKYA